MPKPKLTPWFPAHIKPVRRGVYQCREGDQRHWLWDGKFWRSPNFGFTCVLQVRQWRGLASEPKVSRP